MDANYEALRDLKENFEGYGLELERFPYVLQLNKRDLPDIHSSDYLKQELLHNNKPCFDAVAVKNRGVQETLKALARQLLFQVREEVGRLAAG
jgi:signal recognition particle receptor subunit beta